MEAWTHGSTDARMHAGMEERRYKGTEACRNEGMEAWTHGGMDARRNEGMEN